MNGGIFTNEELPVAEVKTRIQSEREIGGWWVDQLIDGDLSVW